jgi:hypothetical protein
VDVEREPCGGQLPERARMVFTDSHAFRMLGTAAALGRLPSTADEAPGCAARSVVLGHGLWTQQFSSNRNVLGKPLRIDGKTYSVIGVMPPGFRFPAPYWSGGRPLAAAQHQRCLAAELARSDAAGVRPRCRNTPAWRVRSRKWMRWPPVWIRNTRRPARSACV